MLKKLRILFVGLFVFIFSMVVFVACGKDDSVSLKGISVSGYKTEFVLGESFAAGDLVVTAEYSDGTTKVVGNYELDLGDYNNNAVGTYTIVCSYTESGMTKTAEYQVQVNKALVGISATGYKAVFKCGDMFITGGLVVTAEYSDGTTAIVEDYDISCPGFNTNQVGTYTVICSYTENGVTKTAEYEISVVKELTAISVSGYKAQFEYGEEFSIGDLVVTAAYSDGSTKNVEDYTLDRTAYDKNVAGVYTIVCTYEEDGVTKVAEYEVSVVNSLTAISVAGYRTAFERWDDFAAGDLVVTAEYANGSSQVVDNYTFDLTAFDKNNVGKYEVVCSYTENGVTKTAAYEVSVSVTKLRVLLIGNSYSEDTTQYLSAIASGFTFDEVDFYVLSQGSSSLNHHYNNSLSGAGKYYLKHSENGELVGKGSSYSLEYGIKFMDWDYITLQQVSGKSGQADSYNSDLTNLVSYVKKTATNPNVKLIWNMTWAYASNHSGISSNGYGTQVGMYNAICNAVQQKVVTNADFVTVSAVGTAIQNARTSSLGDTLNRDSTHLTYSTGRYIASLTLFCTITGYSVDDVSYAPTSGQYAMTETEISIAKESVKNAIANKFEITSFATA